MNWFEEQIEARRRNDDHMLQNAYEEVINSVLKNQFSFDMAEDALERILHYYHLPEIKIPDHIEKEDEKLSAFCRLSGLMQRRVDLEEGWYKNAFGAYLAKEKETGEWVALLPNAFGQYAYYDKNSGREIWLTKKNQHKLEREAVCFYKPLPAKKLTIVQLLQFGLSAWSLWDYAMMFVLLGIATLIGLLVPKLNNFLYSRVVSEASLSLLLSTMVFLISVNLSIIMINAIRSLFSTRNATKMNAAVRSGVMMRMLSLPVNFFRDYASGDILQRMTIIESVCESIVNMLFSTTLSGLFSLIYVTQIFRYAPALVVPSLLIVIIQVLFSLFITFRQVHITRIQMEKSAANSSMQVAMVSGVQKIKLSGSEKRMFARWVQVFSELTRITFNPPFLLKIHTVITLALSLLGNLIIYAVAIESNIPVADYFAFQSAYATVTGAITALAGIATEIAGLRPSLEMIKPILETLPENEGDCQEVTHLSGSIVMENLHFRYDERMPDVIDGFSLKINPGQYVAIVGKTGCGKSTLIRLLLGFEKPQVGAVYYDGKDLSTLEKRSLRQKVGTVMQDDQLFTGDLYSNIVICAPTLPVEAAWEAAEIAGIADDIRNMPMGMHTLVSEGGGGISGGQRQRLVIARAIAPKPKILIFDEATSALDNVTQKKVGEALDALKCTRIVIAHRLSTIRHCDRIIVMDKGKIIEDGTYETLVQQKGFFAGLVERQRLDKDA